MFWRVSFSRPLQLHLVCPAEPDGEPASEQDEELSWGWPWGKERWRVRREERSSEQNGHLNDIMYIYLKRMRNCYLNATRKRETGRIGLRLRKKPFFQRKNVTVNGSLSVWLFAGLE
jgi:hypothetical protein